MTDKSPNLYEQAEIEFGEFGDTVRALIKLVAQESPHLEPDLTKELVQYEQQFASLLTFLGSAADLLKAH